VNAAHFLSHDIMDRLSIAPKFRGPAARSSFQRNNFFFRVDNEDLPALTSKYDKLPNNKRLINWKGTNCSCLTFEPIFFWSIESGKKVIVSNESLASCS